MRFSKIALYFAVLASFSASVVAQTMADSADSKNMLPKIEIPQGFEPVGPDNLLSVEQIKEIFNGRRFYGKIIFNGRTSEENYEFFSDGSAKMWGNKTIFGGHMNEGKGTWVIRKWRDKPSLCWDIKGTWENRSCSAVALKDGVIYLSTWAKSIN
jgi:hypothetical protein